MGKISVSVISNPRNLENHSHDNAQIIIPIEGVAFLKSDDSEYTIDKNSLAIIPPNVMHYYNGSEDNQIILIDFPKSVLKKDDLFSLTDIRFYFMNDNMQHVKELFKLELENSTSNFAFSYIFYYLYDLMLSKPSHKSIEHIFNNYDSPISIKQLAEIEHYSENYYREWFRKKTGLAPRAYIQRLRIEKGKELLMTTEYSISEIAYQVGFAHHSSFTKAFKESTMIYPREYRKKHK
jgi:AraC-like DNA-binding protein